MGKTNGIEGIGPGVLHPPDARFGRQGNLGWVNMHAMGEDRARDQGIGRGQTLQGVAIQSVFADMDVQTHAKVTGDLSCLSQSLVRQRETRMQTD